MSERGHGLKHGNLDLVFALLEAATTVRGTPLTAEETHVTLMNLARTLHNQVEFSKDLQRRVRALEARFGPLEPPGQ